MLQRELESVQDVGTDGNAPLTAAYSARTELRRRGVQAIWSSVQDSPHWFLTILLTGVVIEGFWAVHLPFAVNWQRLTTVYWLGLGARTISVAMLLWLVGLPVEQTLKPMWARYQCQKFRFIGLTVLAAWMIALFGIWFGIIITIDGIALTELVDRTEGSLPRIGRVMASVLWPATYLFFGLILVFAFNDLIAASKPIDAFDWLYLKLDSYILPNTSVSQLAHLAALKLPAYAFRLLEAVYYGMFGQIGAAILILAICCRRGEAARFVGTLLTAYYLGLILFYFWPSMGPFHTCSGHFSSFPHQLDTYGVQQSMTFKEWLISTHRNLSRVDTDYFIAFPCLHIAQPIVVLWYLRRWRKIAICLLIYDAVLIPAILLLEWHYFVDLIGGVLVAAVAIFWNNFMQRQLQPELPPAEFPAA